MGEVQGLYSGMLATVLEIGLRLNLILPFLYVSSYPQGPPVPFVVLVKNSNVFRPGITHAFNPGTRELETGRFL